LGKRKVLSETEFKEFVLPRGNELLGRVYKMSGGDHLLVRCTDGKTRMCRIRGKLRRRMWIRERDVVLIAPWDFDDSRADVLWRYIKAHAKWLEDNHYLDGAEGEVNP